MNANYTNRSCRSRFDYLKDRSLWQLSHRVIDSGLNVEKTTLFLVNFLKLLYILIIISSFFKPI